MRTDAHVCRRWLASALAALLLLAALPAFARAEGTSTNVGTSINTGDSSPADATATTTTKVDAPATAAPAGGPLSSPVQLPDLTKRENFSGAMQLVILLTVLSLAPAILIMMTSFTRIVIVLSLLRQALGTQQLPPNQILIGLALFMTFLVMRPVWEQVNGTALRPYMDGKIDQATALQAARKPIRDFMIGQIRKANNDEDVLLFTEFAGEKPRTWGDVSTLSLVPGFMLSELKTAFLLGFKVYLPFLVIDMVVSTVLVSMGMMMLPPALISLPFKLLLFVLVDGWRLITAGLMGTFS